MNTTKWIRSEYDGLTTYKCDGDDYDIIVQRDGGYWGFECFEHSAVGGYTDRYASRDGIPDLDSAIAAAIVAAETTFVGPAPADPETV